LTREEKNLLMIRGLIKESEARRNTDLFKRGERPLEILFVSIFREFDELPEE